MRFYVFRAETSTEGAENRQNYAYSTLDEAKQKFHAILSEDINSSSLTHAMSCIIDSDGNLRMSETWTKEETGNE